MDCTAPRHSNWQGGGVLCRANHCAVMNVRVDVPTYCTLEPRHMRYWDGGRLLSFVENQMHFLQQHVDV